VQCGDSVTGSTPCAVPFDSATRNKGRNLYLFIDYIFMINLPSASSIVASTTADAGTWVTTFTPFFLFALALVAAVVAISYVRSRTGRAIHQAAGHRGRGRRRR